MSKPNKIEKKKFKLFDAYNRNLQLVAMNPALTFSGDISSVILCPVCTKSFSKEAIELKELNLDHVPPKTVGGKGIGNLLVCVDCNSLFGGKIDGVLGKHLRTQDVMNFIPGSEADGAYILGPSTRTDATFQISEQQGLHMFMRGTSPKNRSLLTDYLNKLVAEPASEGLKGQIFFPAADPHVVAVALLRIAYLIYFETLGYSAILHPHFEPVRAQILNPNEQVVPASWDVTQITQVDELLPDGVYFVHEPTDLRCVLVRYTLSTKFTTHRHIVCLPAHLPPGLEIYSRLGGLSEQTIKRDLRFIPVPMKLSRELWFDKYTWQAPYYFIQHSKVGAEQ